jgi:ABC-2 type transport system permease protein
MRNMWIIAKREYKHYFISPIAYVIMFTILVIVGIVFALNVWQASQPIVMYSPYVPEVSIITGPMLFMFIFSIPALTMRLLADEHRTGTLELLLTAPLRDWELIAGKWLGSLLFVLTLIVISLLYPLILHLLIEPGLDLGVLLTNYIGLILISAALLAIGVGISAMFSNQIAAFFTTLVVLVVLWFLIGAPADIVPRFSDFFRYIDIRDHFYNSMANGVLNLSDVIFPLTLLALGLFLGTLTIEIRRWR